MPLIDEPLLNMVFKDMMIPVLNQVIPAFSAQIEEIYYK